MKKTLVALAALAVVGAASAQSTVSMTGVIGAAYQSVDSAAGTAARGTTLTNADFKLTAMEDLGGGMRAVASASFETPTPGSSTPSGTFGQGVVRRDTSVGLMGEFGTVSFTNTRSGNLLTKGMVAPANLQDIIYDSNVVTRAAVDAVTYLTKPMNGLQALVQWIDTAADGNTTPAVNVLVLGGTYAQGPLAAGLQYKMHYFTDAAQNAAAPLGGIARKNRLEAFATYDLGMAKVGVGYDGPIIGTIDNVAAFGQPAVDFNQSHAYSLGVAAPVGAMTVGANWAKRNTANMFETVVKYDLSKRTWVNTSWGRQSNDALNGAAGAITTGHQYRVGLYHAF
jgi:predicted porin